MKFDLLLPQAITDTPKDTLQGGIFPSSGEATIHDKLFIVAHDADEKKDAKKQVSSLFCQNVAEYFFQNTCSDEPLTDELLQGALGYAAEQMAQLSPEGVGVEFAMIDLHRHGCMAVHAGKASIYHIRPKTRTLLYRSPVNENKFSQDDNSLKKVVKTRITNIQYGDYFLIVAASGKEMISEQLLMDIICEPVNDKTKQARLKKALSDDNDHFTAYLIHISGVMNEALDEQLPEDESKMMAAGFSMPTSAQTAETPKQQTAPKQSVPKQEKAPQKTHTLPEDEIEEPATKNKREFPVVTVTALSIVLLAGLFWYFSQRPKSHDDDAPVEEVKVEKPQKDTLNIMKGDKPKPLDLPEDKKDKKDEENKPKKEETKVAKPDSTQAIVERILQQQQEQSEMKTSEGDNPQSTVTPIETPAPTPTNSSQGTAAPPAGQPGNTDGVTPRPVIPEDE